VEVFATVIGDQDGGAHTAGVRDEGEVEGEYELPLPRERLPRTQSAEALSCR
jgi:hypothetical protein